MTRASYATYWSRTSPGPIRPGNADTGALAQSQRRLHIHGDDTSAVVRDCSDPAPAGEGCRFVSGITLGTDPLLDSPDESSNSRVRVGVWFWLNGADHCPVGVNNWGREHDRDHARARTLAEDMEVAIQ